MGVFKFKAFSVCQDGCAMKINTDGVLIGAMSQIAQAEYILDIGTGTGVIALMLAQRNATAQLVGVDLDGSSADRAAANMAASPYADRLAAVHSRFQDFVPSQPVSLIVSNPPFYTNCLRNPDLRKGQARHTDERFFIDLLRYASQYLSVTGALELIVPTTLAQDVIEFAADYSLRLTRRIGISSFAESEVIRYIIRFERMSTLSCEESHFIIYEDKGVYSKDYREILKPFFLAF